MVNWDMEILTVVGLAFLAIVVIPITALVIALTLRSRITALEQRVTAIADQLRRSEAAAKAATQVATTSPASFAFAAEPATAAAGYRPAPAAAEQPPAPQAPPAELATIAEPAVTEPTMAESTVTELTSADGPAIAEDEAQPAVAAAPVEDDDDQPEVAPLAASSIPEQEPPLHPSFKPRAASASGIEGYLEKRVGEWWHWLFSGNWMAKIGAIILFIGTAFLVKLAAENSQLPMELRLALLAVGATGGLIWGFRLHRQRPGYAEIIEGMAISVLYLLVFAAASRYELIDKGTALPVMIALVAGGTAIALLQNSQSLAVLALLGGFVAPLLTSSGNNNFVGLFSWYGLLNASVLAICWFRPWPFLNRLALVMTFGIGGAWGYSNYTPADLWLVEPFIVAAFLYFVVIGHLYPWRHREQPGFDTGLLFITPILTTVWQAKVLAIVPYGLAVSAVLAGVFYMALAWLWRHDDHPQIRLLREIDLALGVLFASLAIPLAIDGSIASAAWALEGVGMVWLGLRQQRRLATAFGILLQFAAGALVLRHGLDWESGWFLANSGFATALMLALPALVAGALVWRQAALFGQRNLLLMQLVSGLLLVWGSSWLFGALWYDIDYSDQPSYLAVVLTALLICGGALLQRLWPLLQGWLWLGLLLATLIFSLANDSERLPYILCWLLTSGLWWATLFRLDQQQQQLAGHRWLVILSLWAQVIIVAYLIDLAVGDLLPPGSLWRLISLWLTAVAAILLLLRQPSWPVTRHQLLPVAFGLPLLQLGVTLLLLTRHPGASDPLPWLPLLNAKTLLFICGALVLLRAVHSITPLARTRLIGALAITLFIAIHGEIFGAAHYFGGVYWSASELWDSNWVQTAMAVTWAISGLILTVSGHRRHDHPLWWGGAGLLAATVLKLFIVDLAGSGSIARIVSFMAVGGLILTVGYMAPPPRRKEV